MRSVDWVKDGWLKVLSFTWHADKCWNISRVCSFCDCHNVNIVILKYCHTVNIGRESVHCMESFHLDDGKSILQNFFSRISWQSRPTICLCTSADSVLQQILPLTDFNISRCVWLLSRSGCTAPHSLGDLTPQINFVIFMLGFGALCSFSKLVWVVQA